MCPPEKSSVADVPAEIRSNSAGSGEPMGASSFFPRQLYTSLSAAGSLMNDFIQMNFIYIIPSQKEK